MKDDQSPATKADVAALMESIGTLYAANERWKEELKEDFRLVIEDLRHDVVGIQHDKVEMLDERTRTLDKRVARLEVHTGL